MTIGSQDPPSSPQSIPRILISLIHPRVTGINLWFSKALSTLRQKECWKFHFHLSQHVIKLHGFQQMMDISSLKVVIGFPISSLYRTSLGKPPLPTLLIKNKFYGMIILSQNFQYGFGKPYTITCHVLWNLRKDISCILINVSTLVNEGSETIQHVLYDCHIARDTRAIIKTNYYATAISTALSDLQVIITKF